MGEMSKIEEVARVMIEELRRQAEDNAGTVKGGSSDDMLIDGRGFDMKLVAKAAIEAQRNIPRELKVYINRWFNEPDQSGLAQHTWGKFIDMVLKE